MAQRVGIIGCGVIGGALLKACQIKGIDVVGYDPAKEGLKDPGVVYNTDLVFLCLPTPTTGGNQDLSALDAALMWLMDRRYRGVVVIRSTVLPNTTRRLQLKYDLLNLAHCPEFLTAASPFEDLIKQPVVLIGASNEAATTVVSDFWYRFDKKVPQIKGYPEHTEMAKYMHNCFLATKVSFFNDMAEICNNVGISYKDALDGALAVGQIGKGHTAVPGPDGEPGYGGSCFPKDMNALYAMCAERGIPAETLNGARTGNERRRKKPEDR